MFAAPFFPQVNDGFAPLRDLTPQRNAAPVPAVPIGVPRNRRADWGGVELPACNGVSGQLSRLSANVTVALPS